MGSKRVQRGQRGQRGRRSSKKSTRRTRRTTKKSTRKTRKSTRKSNRRSRRTTHNQMRNQMGGGIWGDLVKDFGTAKGLVQNPIVQKVVTKSAESAARGAVTTGKSVATGPLEIVLIMGALFLVSFGLATGYRSLKRRGTGEDPEVEPTSPDIGPSREDRVTMTPEEQEQNMARKAVQDNILGLLNGAGASEEQIEILKANANRNPVAGVVDGVTKQLKKGGNLETDGEEEIFALAKAFDDLPKSANAPKFGYIVESVLEEKTGLEDTNVQDASVPAGTKENEYMILAEELRGKLQGSFKDDDIYNLNEFINFFGNSATNPTDIRSVSHFVKGRAEQLARIGTFTGEKLAEVNGLAERLDALKDEVYEEKRG